MSRVFVVCEPTRGYGSNCVKAMNLTPAAKWGEIIVVVPDAQSFISPAKTMLGVHDVLKDFCDDDYVLPVGDPILMCSVAAVAMKNNSGKVRFLKWDRRNQDYLVVAVNLNKPGE